MAAKMVKIVLLFLVVTLSFCYAYQMTRCYLVKELRRHNFPEDQIRHWVCLVELRGSLTTDKVIKFSSGSGLWGMFGIYDDDGRMCSHNTTVPGGECNVTCADLAKDDITEAAACAKIKYEFKYFYIWAPQCVNETLPLPVISDC